MRVLFHKQQIVSLVLTTALILTHRLSIAADVVPTDRLLPQETKVYFSVPSVTEFKSRLKQSSFGALMEDKEFAEFWTGVQEQLDKASAELKTQLGLSLDELLSIPSGELAFAVVQPPGKNIGIVAFLDFGNQQDNVDQILEKAAEGLDKAGWTKKTEDFEDTQIDVYKMDGGEGDDAAKSSSSEFAFFVKDSAVVVGSSTDVLESVLVRWDGKHQSTLADNEVYSYILERCSESDTVPAMTWFADPIGLIEGAINSSKQPNFQAQMFLGFLPQLGLKQVKGLGGAIDIATEKYDSIGKTLIYAPPPASGVISVLQFPATEQTPPSWISDQFTAMFAFNWDVIGAFNGIEKLFDSFQGQGAFSAVIEKAANNGPMIHIKTDVVDQLSGKMYFLRGAADEANPLQQKFLMALELQNPDKLKGTIEKLTKSPGFPGKSREFQGETIYEIPQPGGQNQVGITVAKEHLMVASDFTMLEDAIRGDGSRSSLAQNKEFQKIAEHFPAKTSIQGFQRQDTQIQALYEMLRSGNNRLIPGAGGELIPGVDFKKLPPFNSIKKYLKPSGSYSVPDENGALIVSFSVK